MLKLRKERCNFKENFFAKITEFFKPFVTSFTLFKDLEDLKSFCEHFVNWYYHFEEDQYSINPDSGDYNDDMDDENNNNNNNNNNFNGTDEKSYNKK